MKILWICLVANPQMSSHLNFGKWQFRNIRKRIKGESLQSVNNIGQWNSNAIREFEHYDEISLTVVTPYPGVSGVQKFEMNGVNYACFRSEGDTFLSHLKEKFGIGIKREYKKNRKIVSSIIQEINPDVIHIIGAENPLYSLCALDIPKEIPTIISLQTMMTAPGFKDNYPISNAEYEWRVTVERDVIKRCDFIATDISSFKETVLNFIRKDAKFLNMPLAVGVEIDSQEVSKEYDFVYWAADIQKAGDLAIEAFAEAAKGHPGIKLNLSGGYSDDYKLYISSRIKELGIADSVFITGPKESHEEVKMQVKKSKYALLPLKVDFVSGTIREAMAWGLPVVTTITQGTPNLNNKRESVMLSPIGDAHAMAKNMLALLNNSDLSDKLQKNAQITVRELYSNASFMEEWRKNYHKIVDR